MVAIEHPGQAGAREAAPVNTIGVADLRWSLAEGFRDFREKRGDMIIAGMLYPLIGFGTAALTLGTSRLHLLFPLLAGISLLGPLVATGFYELARRSEAGLESGWSHFFDVFKGPRFENIAIMGVLLLGIFVAWMVAAMAIWTAFFGLESPTSVSGLFTMVFGSVQGWTMAILGCAAGFGFALLVLATTVVSLPMLVDREDISPRDAIETSIAVMRHNPGTVLRWGAMVAGLLVLGAIPLLIGLAAVLPILGYATWHLYTRAVDRNVL